jgi:hypothetical protein
VPAEKKQQQTIEDLKKRYSVLHEKKITAQADLNNAKKDLANLKKSAREQFGTDDLDELRAKLKQMKEDNERKRSEYQAHLEKIEAELTEVDRKFAEASENGD